MPILQSSYLPSRIWQNPHVSTIYPSAFRKVNGVNYTRERLELSDGDFLDLDWSKSSENNPKLPSLSGRQAPVFWGRRRGSRAHPAW